MIMWKINNDNNEKWNNDNENWNKLIIIMKIIMNNKMIVMMKIIENEWNNSNVK